MQEVLHRVNAGRGEVVFVWVPGHVGVRGSESADGAARGALGSRPTAGLVPFSGLGPLTARCVYQVWQGEWDETGLVSDRFREVLPRLRDGLLSFLWYREGKHCFG